jgi:para-nitrobenzyl esterase
MTMRTSPKQQRPGRRLLVAGMIPVVAAAAVTTAVLMDDDEADPAVVVTGNGEVRGVVDEEVRRFDGIPYAAPPVGDLRWELPEPPADWSGVRDATEPGAPCVQPDMTTGARLEGSSEDCLYLNVTVPRSADGPVPVMVWFHGGAFSSGAGADYDPRRLAVEGEVAVVTVNSRLGVLGYFGHPGLADSGTYGLADQQAALRWIEENAAAFGGDPERVTLFGNSSGGANICGHLASPESKGLFDGAIIQSGSCRQHWPADLMFPGGGPLSYWSDLGTAADAGSEAASALGCEGDDPIGCLREQSPDDLLALNGSFLTMAYGTPLLPEDPVEAIAAGRFNQVPVLQGNTREEHRYFARIFEIDPNAGADAYRALLEQAFPGQSEAIMEEYPIADSEYGAELAFAAVGTDSAWICPTLQVTEELSARVPTYSYEFADPDAPVDEAFFPSGFPHGSPHGSEVPYLLDLGFEPEWTQAQRELSDRMIEYWTAFATTGSPAPPEAWPASTEADPVTLQLSPEGDRPIDTANDHRCGFWSGQA